MNYTHVLEAFMPITEFDKLMSNPKIQDTKFFHNLLVVPGFLVNKDNLVGLIDKYVPKFEIDGEIFADVTWGFSGSHLVGIAFKSGFEGDKEGVSNSLADFIHNPSIELVFDEETAKDKEDLIESALELIDCNVFYRACAV